MEAFRVLPALSGPQPPPPPVSPRVAPRFTQHKESSAFVVLAEVGDSGGTGTFRGRGFKGSTSSRIPVKSAPSSPGPRAPRPAVGKSVPSSPSKPVPNKRVVTARQPPSPGKALTRPTPRPRVVQKSTAREERQLKPGGKKPSDGENGTLRKRSEVEGRTGSNRRLEETEESVSKSGIGESVANDGTLNQPGVLSSNENGELKGVNKRQAQPRGVLPKKGAGERTTSNKRLNEAGDPQSKSLGDVRKMQQLTRTSSIRTELNEKNSGTNSSGVDGNVTSRPSRPGVGRIAVTMERVNRLRPDKQMIQSTRNVKRNIKNDVGESTIKADKNSEEKPSINSKVHNSQHEVSQNNMVNSNKSVEPSPANIIESQTMATGNKTGFPDIQSDTNLMSFPEETRMDKSALLSHDTRPIVEVGLPNNGSLKEVTSSGNNGTAPKLVSSNGNTSATPTSNLVSLSAGNLTIPTDVEDDSTSSLSSSQLTLVTGTTKVNVEPVKDILNHAPNATMEPVLKNEDNAHIGGVKENGKLLNVEDNDPAVTPNGDIRPKKTMVNGGGTIQNKIIILQSDKNGPVVIGSESLDMDAVIRESIVTETVIPSEEVLLKKEQPDLIPAEVEEPAVTVIGQPDVEVEAANHTVTFSKGDGSMELWPPPDIVEVKSFNGKISPEIHPVSARYNKRRQFRDLCNCCRPLNRPSRCSWRLPWFKKRNGPGPPPTPKVKKKKMPMPSLFSCCKGEGKCKRKKKEPQPSRKPQKATNPKSSDPKSATDPISSEQNTVSAHDSKSTSEPKSSSEPKRPPQISTAPKPTTQTKMNICKRLFCSCCKKKEPSSQPLPGTTKKSLIKKLFCCCCSSKKSSIKPKKQQSQELLKNRRKEMSKSRTTSIQSGFSKLEHSLVEHSSMMRAAIPVLPICLAWTCLILNVFLPGSGTMTSGILCLCFGKPRFSVNDTPVARFGAFFINIVIGIGQIFTIIFCLVGWGWSIWWGVIMLRLARKHRRIKLAEKGQPPAVTQNQDVETGH